MYGRPPVDRLAKRLRNDGQARILFLSNHGSARAMIAESIVNRHPATGFTASSAGVAPEGYPHPMAEELIRAYRLPRPRSKPLTLDEALTRAEREFDFVVALWDRSCGEPHPASNRRGFAASWDVADPRRPYQAGAGIVGSRMGFVRAYTSLRQRITHLFSDVEAESRAVGPPLDERARAEPPARRQTVRRLSERPLPERERHEQAVAVRLLKDLEQDESDARSAPRPAPKAPSSRPERRIWTLGSMFRQAKPSSDVHVLQGEPINLGKSMMHEPPNGSPRRAPRR